MPWNLDSFLLPRARFRRLATLLTRPMSTRSYRDAIDHLNSLQSNAATLEAVRASGGRSSEFAIPEMLEFLKRIGYQVNRRYFVSCLTWLTHLASRPQQTQCNPHYWNQRKGIYQRVHRINPTTYSPWLEDRLEDFFFVRMMHLFLH